MTASTRFVQAVFRDYIRNAGHDAACIHQMKIIKATPGKVTAQLSVQKHNVNRLNTLHGGVICTLVDTLGSLAVSSRGYWLTGVSTDMSISFVRGARLEEAIRAEGSVVNLGKTLCFTKVELFSEASGKLIASGTHTKMMAPVLANPHERNVEFDESGDKVIKGSEAE